MKSTHLTRAAPIEHQAWEPVAKRRRKVGTVGGGAQACDSTYKVLPQFQANAVSGIGLFMLAFRPLA